MPNLTMSLAQDVIVHEMLMESSDPSLRDGGER
jgi:hypothetical protein